MEPYEGPLATARIVLRRANEFSGRIEPGLVYLWAHDAVHNFVDALAKYRGMRGKSPHREIAPLAGRLGLEVNLVDAIRTVERWRNRVAYGGVPTVTAGEARFALDTAERLAEAVAAAIPTPGKRRKKRPG